ncbi:MAG: SOS response-associated peptidase, partial [Mesorhizobium sp.]
MCGRYTRYLSWSEIHRLYRLTTDWERQRNDAPAYNIAPTEDVVFVTAGEDGNHKLREGRWWLVPWWAKEMPKGSMFNARSETADTSGAFKDAFKSKRCLIPADGFYEWTQSPADKGRDPWYIFLPDHRPFSFAGLWAHNDNLGITSCTILTAPAQEPMVSLHDRQPVILAPEVYDA